MEFKAGDKVVIVDTENHFFELYKLVTIVSCKKPYYLCTDSKVMQLVQPYQIKTLKQCLRDAIKKNTSHISLTKIKQHLKNNQLNHDN